MKVLLREKESGELALLECINVSRDDYGRTLTMNVTLTIISEGESMKITLINIEYGDSYKALVVNAMPSEITVEIPDTTAECNINSAVFMAIVKDHSKALAEGIESAEFTLH